MREENKPFVPPKSFIKNLAIQLRHDFELSNNPFGIRKLDKATFKEELEGKKKPVSMPFLGRKNHKEKFKYFLNSSKKGVYLVTGYRGMGKTSFVNNVLNEYIMSKKSYKEVKRIIPIHLTLAQSNPKEIDVLRQVVNSLNDSYKSKFTKWINVLQHIFNYGIIILIFAICINIGKVYWVLDDRHNRFKTDHILILLCIILVCDIVKKICAYKNKTAIKIKNLVKRCHAIVSEEEESSSGFDLKILNNKWNNKKLSSYPVADTKLIEYELIEFLRLEKECEFIFIFDELDKMEMHSDNSDLNEDLETFENRTKHTNYNTLRNRKQAVLNTITGLKNFFTSANARFVFIAGREMFDASLADIADKQSPLSSIFTYSFHIESLLKEEKDKHVGERNTSSLSNEIENFLKYALLTSTDVEKGICAVIDKDKNNNEDKGNNEATYTELLKRKLQDSHNTNEEKLQAYIFLQAFITYLVYRSNGSPKKLIRSFQEFVLINADFTDGKRKGRTTVFYDLNNDSQGQKSDAKNFLYFDYYNQYRIGFINSIYRPFMIQNGRSYKLFSENTITSMPYLFDHLFKFHPFAFSISNLELIPEMMSYNKTPSLKTDLKRIIKYLYHSHIRDTDVELFDYKFNSKTANEITFISRIFEEEAAAFNFTLDEGFNVKEHLNVMIKELRSIHSKYNTDSGNLNPQIFSIANLNTNLGDLYFFDQEFDDALNCYSDAIRSINNLEVANMNQRDFITLVSNKLKIGLCFEKTSSYKNALKFYSDSVQDIKRYFTYVLNKSTYVHINTKQENMNESVFKDYNKQLYYTSSLNDLLQICIQSFLANLFIQEKKGLEGINSGKVKVEFSDFYRIVEAVGKHCNKNRMIIANGMLHHAKLLYFKNSSLLSVRNPEEYDNNYPPKIKSKRKAIEEYFDFETEPKLTRRQPILSFQIYLMGLDEVMRCRNFFEPDTGNTDDDKFLYQKDPSYEKEMHNRKVLINSYLDKLYNFILKNSNDNEYSGEAYTANHYKYIASFLSGIGDCILGMSDLETGNKESEGNIMIHQVELDKIVDFTHQDIANSPFYSILKNEYKATKFSLTDVFKCYYLAAKFYEKYGRISSASFEYRKILQVLMMVLPDIDLETDDTGKYTTEQINLFLENLKNNIVNKAHELNSTALGRVDSHMINKIKSDLNFKINSASTDAFDESNSSNVIKIKSNDDNTLNIPIDYLAANSIETKEISLIYEYIRLKIQGCDENKVNEFVNSHYPIYNQFLRITELDYYAKHLHKKIRIKRKDIISNHTEFDDILLEFFYSKIAIVRIIDIYETDYSLGPAFAAYVHYSIAKMLGTEINTLLGTMTILEWIQSQESCVKSRMTVLTGKSMTNFDRMYHYKKSRDFYTSAIQLHTAGQEYQEHIKEMIYLEDDFNDNAYHFGAAYERYLMVNNFFTKKIEEIDIELKKLKDLNQDKILIAY